MATPLNLGAIELKEQQARAVTFPKTANHPETLAPSRVLISPKSFVNPSEPTVSDKIYSGFLEHLGRCIYGGIVDDPKKPSDEKLLVKQDKGDAGSKGRLGWRKDVIDVIGGKGELEVPIFRWPGGQYRPTYLGATTSIRLMRGTS
jgi:alpha-N-arabinofuranosidase